MRSLFQSMTSRIVLILIGGVLGAALLTLGLALGERQQMITQFREYHAVERVAQFVLSLETVPPGLRARYLAAAAGIGMRAELASNSDAPASQQSELAAMLEKRLAGGHTVASSALQPADCGTGRRKGGEHRNRCEALLVKLESGERLRLTVIPPRPPPLAPRGDWMVYGVLFLISVGVLAAIIARMTMQPLKRLAEAATELGDNIERPPLPERGATEIRQAAAAFNAMQSRIRQHIQQRSHILAAITHDLQTPLTRLRLRLEKVDDPQLRDKLIGDLSAMQGMVREGLDLARSMDSAEKMQVLDLDSMIDSVCTDAIDAGQPVTFNGNTGVFLQARPMALRRCLTNLIDNAVKYGGRAEVSATRTGSSVMISVRDDGPGIPDAELENVFSPFYRLEQSRSRDTGGTGLGLTIARNIAQQHRGTLQLMNRPEGGLEGRLVLPVSAG
ncbi:ATP-binding protein [Noviherbaspirillum sp.]|uniref:ATP-binding protein n=1 Tax=Noviherbaspirillum sp. TaxID=1926288 RepID=UPI002FE1E5C0